MSRIYANNAITTFANPVASTDTTLTVTSASSFAVPSGGSTFQATLSDAATNTVLEIVTVTGISGNILTVTRAQEGTSAQSYLAGDNVSQRTTALELSDFLSQTYGGSLQSPLYGTTLTMSGLLYGNGGATGYGYGQIWLQSGGSPSGGSNGDFFLIY